MNNTLKKSYPYITAIILFLVLSAIYFAPQLDGYVIKQHDIEQYIGMSKEIADFRTKYHEEPLWTNTTFGGMPAYQISTNNSNIIDSAKNLILKVIPRPIGYLFIMMVSFYIMLLCFGVNPWLSIIGAVAFGFSSFNMLYLGNGHNAKVHAISFIPPIIGGIYYAYRKNMYIGALILSIFTCLHLSANHVQITYYLLFLIFAILVVEFYRFFTDKALPKFFKISGVLLIAGILGVLPSISNLIITEEYGKHSTRGKSELTLSTDNQETENSKALDPEYIKRYNLGKGEIWSLVIPDVKGGTMNLIGNKKDIINQVDARFRQDVANVRSYWGEQLSSGGTFYYGASVFLLFVLGLFFIKDKIKWAVLAACILAVLLSFKYGLLIDFFIAKFPLFDKFRDSKMILIIIQLSFPLMGVLFIKSLINNEVDKKRFLYVSMGVTGLLFLFYVMPTVWFDFLSKQEASNFDQQMSAIRNNANYLKQYEDFKSEIINARVLIFKKDVLRSLLFILATFAVLYLFLIKKIKESLLIVAIGIIVLTDIWNVSKRYLNNEKRGSQYLLWVDNYSYLNPFQPTVADMDILNNELKANPALQQSIEKEVSQLKNTKKLKPAQFNLEKIKLYFTDLNYASDYRVLALNGDPFSSARESYFHKSLGGYHGAKLRRFNELITYHVSREMYKLTEVLKKYPSINSLQEIPGLKVPVLNMLNTKYFIYNPNNAAILNPNHFICTKTKIRNLYQ